ncbi:single-stranded DNA binding protein [Natrarchaeobaculum sulfurireducens]|uniref:Replication factor A (SsDNA-binding protein) n=1 Tax=Natrarchaeobaculum sulfurireducens TaxID=2044521 RepID=A0A346PUW2_9EURY|nr:single-stranded DNA binding protein [Natrarchaeobaculum sulfurireducens]AXR79534.1 Single-stranded DNA-binding replication protein A (RPA) [Natrarchaeobaculum sulfurireducens]AXR83307.1 Replication factor A (ssDNA-binding protein) [Natrarchaeobaculum sulfurireducens]
MSDIEGVYEDLEADVSLEEFREAVEAKVEQMGGLADEETAAMLVAHEIGESEVGGVADIEPGMEEAKFVAKVISIGELRTFERDGEDADGRVVNVEVADETGSVRAAFWDEHAEAAVSELEEGQVLKVAGRPKEGFSGVEVSVDDVEPDDETEIDVTVSDTHTVEDLSLGLSNVNLVGLVLDTGSVRTFDRDDGSEGRVSNLTLGDETGRIRVTLWDERADLATELEPDATVEVVDGYVKERDGNLELHVGNRGTVEEVDEDVEYVPESTPIETVEIGQTVDIAGVVRSADPKRTFDRDDGSEGQVRNIRVQDATDDIRVALWGEKADVDVGPGDEVALGDVEIQDGWQDDLEASAGWQSTITVLESESAGDAGADDDGASAGLSAFADGADNGDEQSTTGEPTASDSASDTDDPSDGEELEFTGVVVQAGNPVVLDDGETTMSVATNVDVGLGEEITARGVVRDGRLEATDVF